MSLIGALGLVLSVSVGVSAPQPVWLSDSSLTFQSIAMHFPAAHPDRTADGSVLYCRVFNGIDLHVYRGPRGFEYDWIVAPGAAPGNIVVSFSGGSGATAVRIASDGDLVLSAPQGEIRHTKPFAYQEIDGVKREIPAQFEISGDGAVGFGVGSYDPARPLIIDPSLTFASGIGGTNGADSGTSIALDSAGNIYLAGLAGSSDFPLVNSTALPATCASLTPCNICPAPFVAKLSPDGTKILYSAVLASCGYSAPAIAVDSAGTAFVAGSLAIGASLVQAGGGIATSATTRAFVIKLDPTGAIKAALNFGGSGADAATSIQLGADGNLVVAGTTTSPDFPVTTGAFHSAISSAQDLFALKLNAALLAGNQPPANSILYSTFLGPGAAPTVAVDATGNAYIAASTTSTAWIPTAGAYQPVCWDAARAGCADAIALKLNSGGSGLAYMTYLGGSETDTAGAIAVDAQGSAYITGTTSSFDFPATSGAYLTSFPLSATAKTAFSVKLSADGTRLIYGTFLITTDGLTGTALAIDGGGNVWVGGAATQPVLPVANGIQQSLFNSICTNSVSPGASPNGEHYCPASGYLVELNPAGSALLAATYLGAQPSLSAIAFDAGGNLLVTGNRMSLLKTTAAPAATNGASVVKIAPTGTSLGGLAVQIAAGFQSGLPAPGGIGVLYFTAVPPPAPAQPQTSGLTILVDGISAPLIPGPSGVYSLPNNAFQANFQVPVELAQPAAHVVEVNYNGQSAFIVPQQAAPGIFTLPSGGGAIQHAADYSLVTVQNPVVRGETIIIYATGLGRVGNPVPTGMSATGADPINPNGCNAVFSNAGTVLYAGLTPGITGLYQVNVQVSQSLPSGTNYFYLESAGCWVVPGPVNYESNAVGVYVP
jgi:uncharacterized protein (TIGR03437 family)